MARPSTCCRNRRNRHMTWRGGPLGACALARLHGPCACSSAGSLRSCSLWRFRPRRDLSPARAPARRSRPAGLRGASHPHGRRDAATHAPQPDPLSPAASSHFPRAGAQAPRRAQHASAPACPTSPALAPLLPASRVPWQRLLLRPALHVLPEHHAPRAPARSLACPPRPTALLEQAGHSRPLSPLGTLVRKGSSTVAPPP